MVIAAWIVFSIVCRPLAAQVSPDVAGTWQGTLETGKGFRMVLKMSKGAGPGSSGWQGVLYSIDGYMGSEERAASITLQGASFSFAIAPINVSYQGKLSADGMSIAGAWTESGQSHPLNFVRANAETAWAIPEAEKNMAADADPEFEVATIKLTDPAWRNAGFHSRGRHISCDNRTLSQIVTFAYGIHRTQLAGAPDWFVTDRYTIDGVANVEGEPNLKQMQGMYRKLLTDRFHLVFHREKRELSVYALRVAKNGPKLERSLADPNAPPDSTGGPAGWRFTNNSMAVFAFNMQLIALDKPVVDQTELPGTYDFYLRWTPDGAPTDDPNAPPGLFTAIQEQIGLKLEPAKAQAEVLVIDKVERPSEN